MEIIDKIFDVIGKISLTLSIDMLIIIGIVGISQLIKVLFKPTEGIVLLSIFLLGVCVVLFKIFIENLPIEEYLRVIFGYPGFSMCLYMLIKKYLPDTFLSKELLSSNKRTKKK